MLPFLICQFVDDDDEVVNFLIVFNESVMLVFKQPASCHPDLVNVKFLY